MQKILTKYFFIAATAIVLVTLLALARHNYNDPERVFHGMLDNHLSSQGVTRTVNQDSPAQRLHQTIQAQTGADNVVAGRTILEQGEGQNATRIVTESLGTLSTDYVRYADIDTTQPSVTGGQLDFSDILNVWGKTSDDGALAGGELFGEAVLGVVPFGYLPLEQRQQLIDRIEELNVYEVNYGQVGREINNQRPVYIYTVSINLERYVTMLKEFAGMVNIDQLDATDPALFRNSPQLNVTMEVDVWSRQLRAVQFNDSQQLETYGAYGLQREINLPDDEDTISVQELQQRLQTVQ